MNVQNASATVGNDIITFRYNAGGNEKFKLVRTDGKPPIQQEFTDAITGYPASGSSYEQCFYNKDNAGISSYGIGLSDNAMKGISADNIGGKNYIMPKAINDYIVENLKEDDGWLLAYFNNDKQLMFHQAGTRYIDKDGNYAVAANVKSITPETEELTSGAYIVEGDITVNHRINIPGLEWPDSQDVLIILADDSSLTVNGGIVITGNWLCSTLTISSQSLGEHMGSLIANGTVYGPGIGVASDTRGSGSHISIFGGNITANGGKDGAGIGTGDAFKRTDMAGILIYGGNITANGGGDSAGIGTGYAHNDGNHCSYIVINGGNVMANGAMDGAGIGTGAVNLYTNSIDTITITGGNVIANGGRRAAGIGTGADLGPSNNTYEYIHITGGSIIANPGEDAQSIGTGAHAVAPRGTIDIENVRSEANGSSQWVNLVRINEKAAGCETPGYKEAYRESYTEPEKTDIIPLSHLKITLSVMRAIIINGKPKTATAIFHRVILLTAI